MQLFLFGYLVLSICEIFTIGGFPLEGKVRIVSNRLYSGLSSCWLNSSKGFTGAHLGIITATTWVLMLNGAVGYQALDDGSFVSMVLLLGSAAALFVGTGYIALDTGFDWTGHFSTQQILQNPNRSYSLYTLYLLCPLVFLSIYFILESWLVLRVLGEVKPMRKLSSCLSYS